MSQIWSITSLLGERGHAVPIEGHQFMCPPIQTLLLDTIASVLD